MILQPDKPALSSNAEGSDSGSTIYMDELPPAYSEPPSVPSTWRAGQEKRLPSPGLSPSLPESGEGSITPGAAPLPSPSAGTSKFMNAAAWFTFGALSRTDREVKATVLGLVCLTKHYFGG
jgi:hypothetical protein